MKHVIQLRVEEKQVLTFFCDKIRESIKNRQILSTLDKIDLKKTFISNLFESLHISMCKINIITLVPLVNTNKFKLRQTKDTNCSCR